MSEEDPVADFLAREADQMAELDPDLQVDDFSQETELPQVGRGVWPERTVLKEAVEVEPAPVVEEPARVAKPIPEKIKKWEADQKDRLEKKDLAEEMKNGELKAAASKELEQFHKDRLETIEKKKKLSREVEVELIRERDAALAASGGKEGQWERITKLCEFTPKLAKNHKDVSRLRTLLLQMKASEGPPARD